MSTTNEMLDGEEFTAKRTKDEKFPSCPDCSNSTPHGGICEVCRHRANGERARVVSCRDCSNSTVHGGFCGVCRYKIDCRTEKDDSLAYLIGWLFIWLIFGPYLMHPTMKFLAQWLTVGDAIIGGFFLVSMSFLIAPIVALWVAEQ